MGITIDLDENQRTRLSDLVIETRPPDRIEFVGEGVITMTEELLGAFEGMAVKPAEVRFSLGGAQTVTIDLTEQASLRLEAVDVGVETPDTDDVSAGMDPLDPTTDDSVDSPGVKPGAIAFTVEGAIRNVSEEAFELLSENPPTVESITFSVDDAVRSDGGSNTVLLEVTLLGFGIVIRRNGAIEIGTRGGVTDVGRP